MGPNKVLSQGENDYFEQAFSAVIQQKKASASSSSVKYSETDVSKVDNSEAPSQLTKEDIKAIKQMKADFYKDAQINKFPQVPTSPEVTAIVKKDPNSLQRALERM